MNEQTQIKNSSILWLALVLLGPGCSQEGRLGGGEINLEALPEVAASVEIQRGNDLPARYATIALTGELRGELQPCGCPTVPYGGFGRRQAYLTELSREGRPIFQLDTGDALLKGVSSDRSYVNERSSAILDLMRIVGVDVMVPGPSDFAAVGLDRLGSSLGFNVVSATWVDGDGELVFPGSVVLTREGVSIGVVGLSAAVSSDIEGAPNWVDPVIAVRGELERLPTVDVVVAVSNLGSEDNVRISEEVSGIGLILSGIGGGGEGELTVPVVETPARGRYLSTVKLRLASDSGEPVRVDSTSYPPVADFDSWEEARRRVLGLSVGIDVPPEAVARSAETLSQRELLLEGSGVGLNLALVEDRPLGTVFDTDEDTSQAQIRVASFLTSVSEIAQAAVTEVSDGQELNAVGEFQTSAGCVACHSNQFARWTFTEHKSSTIHLTAAGEQDNPECLGCHTTGYGQTGGFAEPNQFNLSRFGGIQCEVCHGALSNHPDSGSPTPATPNEETCLACHDEANSPDFDYDSYMRSVTCNQSG